MILYHGTYTDFQNIDLNFFVTRRQISHLKALLIFTNYLSLN